MSFPPIPLYPNAIDSDRTLFTVYNTSETTITANNLPWSQEISIEPVGPEEDEIWAGNGFANISGELFYYDDVERNGYDKVIKFKKCARNLGGKKTKFNPTGTWVRGFVIAEHHQQLVQTILNAEEFIGINFSEKHETLDWRIRHLNIEPICEDDHGCPDVNFDFKVVTPSTDGCTGTVAEFNLEINGFFKNFKIDFGDGTSTTSEQSGTHTFPPNSKIDPIVTVSNDNCQVVQTAIAREEPDEPEIAEEEDVFNIEVPVPPDFPTIIVPDITIPDTTLTLPQIGFPCELGLSTFIPSIPGGGGGGSGGGGFNFGDLNIPSMIEFGTIDIPSTITVEFGDIPSITVEFGEPPSITVEFGELPSITVEFDIPSFSPIQIEFGELPSFSPIEFGEIPSFSPIQIEFGELPSLTIEFGEIPSIAPIEINIDGSFPSIIEIGPVNIISVIEVVDNLISIINVIDDVPDVITVIDDVPDVITVIDDIPDIITLVVSGGIGSLSSISVDWGEPPSPSITWGTPPACSCTVAIECPGNTSQALRSRSMAMALSDDFDDPFLDVKIDTQDIGIPSQIQLVVPTLPDIKLVHDLPTTINIAVPIIPDIRIIGPEIPIPKEIRIIQNTIIPSQIELISEIPQVIELIMKDVPVLEVKIPEKFPEINIIGNFPTTIQVVGVPETIELVGYIPSEIQLKPPENYEIPMVYKGAPIPVRFDWQTPTGEDGEERPCFALVPCK